MFRIGLFATGRGQGSLQLVTAVHNAVESGSLPISVEFVFSNREPGEFEPTDRFFDAVQGFGYPLVTRSFRRFKRELGDDPEWRVQYDRETIKLLAPFNPELCVLAGYLLIFSPELCNRYPVINLHPSAPGGPIGMWQNVIWQLIEARATASGNMMQLVTPEVDKGLVVSFSTYPITGPVFAPLWHNIANRTVEDIKATEGEELPLFQAIREAGTLRERQLLLETLRTFAQGRMKFANGTAVDEQGHPVRGLDLTEQIETRLRAAD